jgi:hypothetical protein
VAVGADDVRGSCCDPWLSVPGGVGQYVAVHSQPAVVGFPASSIVRVPSWGRAGAVA